ncbi:Swt1 family HEPN domain-containing protein [Tessaracoccus lubricantis]|uniref:Swt1 family HEPN domain-containing protein n=1 Tax=Tessaracoccus lubricantis TaxID=545543 RepID=A0ABP9F2A8_9ACTN
MQREKEDTVALSNRELIGRLIEELGQPLNDYLSAVLGPRWIEIVRTNEVQAGIGGAGKAYNPLDPQEQLKVIGMRQREISRQSGHGVVSYASELRAVRNDWAHMNSVSTPNALRALDTGARLLADIGAKAAAERVRRYHDDLNRRAVQSADQKVLAQEANIPASQGLKPWREVLRPHEDVASGRFRSSEFAADLYKVAKEPAAVPDYSDPAKFFARTYLTEGLRDLIGRAVGRLSGDANASPVINLQTNFGGGKTHSMLALWHLAAGESLDVFPQELQELLTSSGYVKDGEVLKARRAALVGQHIAPQQPSIKEDGTQVNTLWGELAWQLGGREAFELVAAADASGTSPGEGLHTLLARYSPCVILVDEWVAYARQLFGKEDLVGGTFDTQFTFAQQLTEVAKSTPGVMLAISIPASHDGDDRESGHNEEVGGRHGQEALKRLQNVVRRVADQWRPASAEESYHIVRQRLFEQPDANSQATINATARAFVEFYTRHGAEFPKEARDMRYEERIRQTYPIHPEVFDRLYEDWSALERFQRTRGVLRLMNAVIHALWASGDQSPMILPGSVPLYDNNVNSELTQYLSDSWKAVIDADVDGEGSQPWKIDSEKPLLGQRQLTKRLARTVFFGAAPTHGTAQKGLEAQRVFLGVATPGDTPGNFHSAMCNLADRATYFYSANGRYWYDLQANITRRAKDQAERLHPEDVWAEIVRRLTLTERATGAVARVHVCPEDSSDVLDTDEARLVILHPKVTHTKNSKGSDAMEAAQKITTSHGSGMRTYRNMLVYLAADAGSMENLDAGVRDFLGWSYVLDHAADLDLTHNQKQQADDKRRAADATVADRLRLTYTWGLIPEQADGAAPFTISELRIDGAAAASLTERLVKKLGTEDLLRGSQSATAVRMVLDRYPQLWSDGHVRVGALWDLYARYPYLHRLRDQQVFLDSLTDLAELTWESDAFALAADYSDGRYSGLVLPTDSRPASVTSNTLIVKPQLALEQRANEQRPAPELIGPGPVVGPGPDHTSGGTAAVPEKVLRRYFGAKTLSGSNAAMEFATLSREVLAHLVGDTSTEVRIRVEIEAERPEGFGDTTVRTVSENANALKFDDSGFEQQ